MQEHTLGLGPDGTPRDTRWDYDDPGELRESDASRDFARKMNGHVERRCVSISMSDDSVAEPDHQSRLDQQAPHERPASAATMTDETRAMLRNLDRRDRALASTPRGRRERTFRRLDRRRRALVALDRGERLTRRALWRAPTPTRAPCRTLPARRPRRRVNAEARAALERAFLDLLGERHPGVVWTVDRPDERPQRHGSDAAGGEVVGGLPGEQDGGTLVHRDAASRAHHHDVKHEGE